MFRNLLRSKSMVVNSNNLVMRKSKRLKQIQTIQIKTIQILNKYFDKATNQKKIEAYITKFTNQKSIQKYQNLKYQKKLKNNQNNLLINHKQYIYGKISNELRQKHFSLKLNKEINQQIKRQQLKINHIKQESFIVKIIKKIKKTQQKQNQIEKELLKNQRQTTNQLPCLIQEGNLQQQNQNINFKKYTNYRRNKSEAKEQKLDNDNQYIIRQNKVYCDKQQQKKLQRIQKISKFQQMTLQYKNSFHSKFAIKTKSCMRNKNNPNKKLRL